MSIFNKYKYANNYKRLLIACYLFNMFTFAIKLVYTAQLPAIQESFNIQKTQTSLGLTIYYFIYAVSQIGLGLIVTKINMKTYMLITSALSAITFSLIGFTNSLTVVWVIFGLNGFLQAGCWGGVVFIISKYFPNDTLSFSNKILSTSSTVGNSLTYAVSALFVAIASWKTTYVFFGILFLASIIYMFIEILIIDKISKRKDEYTNFETVESKDSKVSYVVPCGVKFNTALFMTFIIIVSTLANCLLYGLGSWIPNLLKEVHGFPTALSILITMIMPLIAMTATLVMYSSFDKTGKIFTKAGYIGFVLFILTIIMVFGYNISLVFAILMSALLKYLPQSLTAGFGSYPLMKIKNYINSGSSVLIVNSGAAFAAGGMPFVTALIMDNFGWDKYYLAMAGIALVCVILIIIGNYVIKKRNNIAKWF